MFFVVSQKIVLVERQIPAPLREVLDESYFGDIEEFKKFIKTAGDQDHYLLVAEA